MTDNTNKPLDSCTVQAEKVETMPQYSRGVEATVTVLIQDNSGRVLLARNAKWGDRLVPGAGGHIEPGETIIEAARREVREEVGLDITDLKVLGWGEVINPVGFYRTAHFVGPFVVARIVSGEPTPDGVEVIDTVWLSRAEALARADLADYARPYIAMLN